MSLQTLSGIELDASMLSSKNADAEAYIYSLIMTDGKPNFSNMVDLLPYLNAFVDKNTGKIIGGVRFGDQKFIGAMREMLLDSDGYLSYDASEKLENDTAMRTKFETVMARYSKAILAGVRHQLGIEKMPVGRPSSNSEMAELTKMFKARAKFLSYLGIMSGTVGAPKKTPEYLAAVKAYDSTMQQLQWTQTYALSVMNEIDPMNESFQLFKSTYEQILTA